VRVLLDLQGCQSESRGRGIGRYLLGLARALCHTAAGHEVWLLLNDLLPATVMPLRVAFEGLVPGERIAVFRAPGPASEEDPQNHWRMRAGELIREHAIVELAPDVVLVGSLFEGFVDDAVVSIGRLPGQVPTAVVLYDLIPWVDWQQYLVTPLYRGHYLRKMESLRRADLWLTISEASRAEACAVLGVAGDAVVNVSVGLDARFRAAVPEPARRAELARELGLCRPFLMHIGAIEPRKNFDALITAYARLPEPLRSAHQLLLIVRGLASEQERLRNLARALGLADPTVVVVSDVQDEDLIALYSTCALFVFPTLHEGFGLPVLEAMACGAVAIGSAASSIPELLGHDALFDPRSVDDMARVMARALGDAELRASLRAAAPGRVASFSWDAVAQRTWRALEQLAERRTPAPASRSAAYRALPAALALEEGTPSREDLVACAEAIACNFVRADQPQLLLDVSELAERDAGTGIQRVVRAILLQWLKQPPAGYRVEPIRFDRALGCYRYARRFSAEFAVAPRHPAAGDTPVDARPGDLFVGLDLVADRLPVDWIAALRRRGVRVAFVVYDTLPLRCPHWWPEGTGAVFEAWARGLVQNSDVVVGISRFVTEDLKLWMAEQGVTAVRPPRFLHFALGADLAGTSPTRGLPGDADAVLARMRSGPTLLMLGTIEPRKGHAQALAAFEQLWLEACDVRLVIVGRQGWMMDATLERMRAHPERGARLFWLEGVSDEYLELLFAAASALLVASEGEGFGLPLIEGARHGLPLVVRDLPVFREVAGDHPVYFSGTSPSDLAQAVRTWLRSPEPRERSRRPPFPLLTWAESAQQLWAALESADPSAPHAEP
jgi:glycosyltransferase involved in cell wall biosynthesis